MEKEHWKDEVLRSLEGARRAEPKPELYAGIRARIEAGRMQVVRRPYVALAAACLLALAAANVWALRQRPPETSSASAYQIESADFDLY